MIDKHSPNNKQQEAGKSFEICARFPCDMKAKLYVSILLRFHTAKSSRDCSRGELAKGFILQ